MGFYMKTTLNIDDTVMKRLRQMSARTGRMFLELLETALRRLLQKPAPREKLPPLPAFDGGAKVNVAGRDALYRAMEGR